MNAWRNKIYAYLRDNRLFFSISLLTVTATFCFLVLNIERIAFYDVIKTNADILFVEEIARTSNAGEPLFNWRLPQAPLIFPEILGAKFLALFLNGIGEIIIFWQFAFCIGISIAWIFIAANSKRSPWLSAWDYFLLALSIYFISIWVGTFKDKIFLFGSLTGYHTSVGLFLPLISILAYRALTKPNEVWSLITLCFLIALGGLSDNLILLAVVSPLIFAILFAAYSKCFEWRIVIKVLLAISFSACIAKLFSYANPFPQDRAYANLFIQQFPRLMIDTYHRFVVDALALFKVRSTRLLLIWSGLSYLICTRYVFCAEKSLRGEPLYFSAVAIFISIPLIITLQVVFGIYGDMELARQWMMFLFAGNIVGLYIFLQNRSKKFNRSLVFIILVLSAIFSASVGFKNQGTTIKSNRFEELVACIRAHGITQGSFLADYWVARPLRMYSNGSYYAIPMIGQDLIYTPISNVKLIRLQSPTYVVTGLSLKRGDYERKFGLPLTFFTCTTNGGNFDILNYKSNVKFKTDMQAMIARTG